MVSFGWNCVCSRGAAVRNSVLVPEKSEQWRIVEYTTAARYRLRPVGNYLMFSGRDG